MIIKINENRTIKKYYEGKEGSLNENNVTEIEFLIPEIYSEFSKKIVFMSKTENFSKNIDSNNKYIIDNDVSKYKKIYCYVWLQDTENDIDFRSELFEMNFDYNIEESEEIEEIDEDNS